MEEEKKEEKKEIKQEPKTKKGTDFLTLICFFVICVIIMGFILGKVISVKYNDRRVSLNDFKNVEIKTVKVIEPENRVNEESIEDDIEEKEELEIDIGNKIYPDQKYVFLKEKQEIYFDYEEGWNELNLFVINIDSDEIRAINKEIEEYYNDYKSCYSDETLIKEEAILPRLFYYYWIYDEILSVRCYYNYNENYSKDAIYNIDIRNKTLLSNKDLLRKVNIEEDKFESLVYDSLLSSFLHEKRVGSYNDFNKYLGDIKFDKNEKQFVIDYNEICDLCNLSLVNGYEGPEDNLIQIEGLSIPTYWHPSILDSISIEMESRYIFNYSYGYNLHYEDYKEHYGKYVSNNIPVINIKSDDADKINKKLEEFFKKAEETIEKNGGELVIKSVKTGENLEYTDEIVVNKDYEKVIDDYYTIDYSCEIIDNQILTILVEESNSRYSNLDHGMNEHFVFNFDLETGKLLTNKEFIEKCGYSIEDFRNNNGLTIDIEKLTITPIYGVSGEIHEPSKIDKVTEFYIIEDNNTLPFEWKKIEMK